MGDTLETAITINQDLFTNPYEITINWGNYTSFRKYFLYKSYSYKTTNASPFKSSISIFALFYCHLTFIAIYFMLFIS